MTLPPFGMMRSVQIWKGLFAFVQVTVCPAVGIGGWLHAAYACSVAKKPTAMKKRMKLMCLVSGFVI
jgi:hypothetical protein